MTNRIHLFIAWSNADKPCLWCDDSISNFFDRSLSQQKSEEIVLEKLQCSQFACWDISIYGDMDGDEVKPWLKVEIYQFAWNSWAFLSEEVIVNEILALYIFTHIYECIWWKSPFWGWWKPQWKKFMVKIYIGKV